MSTYISESDLTDILVTRFPSATLTTYLDESDDAVEDLAEERGIRTTSDIETNPVHYKVKRFAIAYVGMRICEDHAAANNNEAPVDLDKYWSKAQWYKEQASKLRTEITSPMLTGDVDEIRDRATLRAGLIFRG